MNDSTPSGSFEDYRFAAYLSGTMSPDDQAAFDAWIVASPDAARRFDAARTAWAAGVRPPIAVDTDTAWSHVRGEIAARNGGAHLVTTVLDAPARDRISDDRVSPDRMPHDRISQSRGRRPDTGARRWLNGIAISLGAAAIALGVGMYGRDRSTTATTHTYATRVGQRATVRLAGGTVVNLGPGTTLLVTEDEGSAVTVTVRGEVLFHVVHRADHPFVVLSQSAVARVLGTTFFVRQYETDRTAEIAVVDGRVGARGRVPTATAGAESILAARMICTVSDSGVVSVRSNVDAQDYLDRASGELVFRNAPVSVIIGDLSRAYGVEIALADSVLATRALTFSVNTERRSLDDVLNALSVTLDAHYERTGNTISVRTGRRTTSHPPFPPKLESTYGR